MFTLRRFRDTAFTNLMRDKLKQLFRELRARVVRVRLAMTPDRLLTPMQRFQRDGYASLLTRGASLGASSTVLDVGGHIGLFTDSVLARCPCRVEVFEPMPSFAALLAKKYAHLANVTVHPYGLAAQDCERTFYTHGDGTGEFVGGSPVTVRFRGIVPAMESLPETLSLVAINIEGGEFELIPLLIDNGLMPRIERLVVQFHRINSDSENRREAIRRALQATHECKWNYDFVWECWEPSHGRH